MDTYSPKSKTFLYIMLIILALGITIPIIWVFFLTFKDNREFFSSPFTVPKSINWDNYVRAIKTTNLLNSYKNSLIITISSITLSLIISVPASYALARLKFKWNKGIYLYFIIGLVVPVFSVIYPLFIINKEMGLINNYLSVILPNVAFAVPINTLILVGFMKTIPKELEEADVIDGGDIFSILFRIIIPISTQGISAVVIFNFIQFWNDFAVPFIMLGKDSMKTLPVVMTFFNAQYGTDFPGMAAGLVMSMVPTLIFYGLFQKYVMRGMTAGAVKG